MHDFASGQKLYDLPLDIGQVISSTGKRNESEIFYSFQSFLTPGIIYRLDFASAEKPEPEVKKLF